MALIAPTVEVIGDEALTNSIIDKSITEIQDDLVTDIREHAFYNCTALKKAVFGSVSDVDDRAFDGCTALTTVDFHTSTPFGDYVFNNCSALTALILRGATVCHAISGTLQNSGIASGNGYVYVPAALLDAYKAHGAWGQYANQIRAIEDYPEVCGTAGKAWKQSNITNEYTGVLFENGVFVAYRSGGGVQRSEDGREWSSASIGGSNGWYYGACGNGVFVLGKSNTGLYRSTNGNEWSNVYSGSPKFLAFENGAFFAYVASVGFLKSEDGETWTLLDYSGADVKSIASNGNLLVVGDSAASVYCSSDGGTTWTKSNYPGTAATVLRYGNGVFVCGGSGGLYYSDDGFDWTKSDRTATAAFLTFQNGLFHTAAGSGGMFYSEDGATWTKCSTIIAACQDVVCENGVWVTADSSMNKYGFYYSYDGKDWVRVKMSLYAKDFCFGNGVFCAVTLTGLYYSE